MKNDEVVNVGVVGGDLTISGLLLGRQQDNITYVSKKTNQQVEASREVLVLQTSFGIVICRSFSNDGKSADVFKALEIGRSYCFAVTSYQIDNGLKCATVRVS